MAVIANRVKLDVDGVPQPVVNFEVKMQPLKQKKKGIGQILDTVGIELESLGKTQNEVSQIIKSIPGGISTCFKVHRDASSEMICGVVQLEKKGRYLAINTHTPGYDKLTERKQLEKETYGYELVSIPLEIDLAELAIRSLLPTLENNGDFTSNRCATHIHVGMGINLYWLKNALRLGLWADDLFYSISGMGGNFRGMTNNAIYARPLTSGPYFTYGDTYFQCLNWEKALSAKTVEEFFYCYAIDIDNGPVKYHPCRYFSINLYSAILNGTLEFRHFNQSFNPGLVVAITKLCQMFTEIIIKADSSSLRLLDVCNVFELQPQTYYISKLYKLLSIAKSMNCKYTLDNRDITNLLDVITKYNGIGLSDVPVLTHIKEVATNLEVITNGNLVMSSKRPVKSGNIDIHNIQYSSIMEG